MPRKITVAVIGTIAEAFAKWREGRINTTGDTPTFSDYQKTNHYKDIIDDITGEFNIE